MLGSSSCVAVCRALFMCLCPGALGWATWAGDDSSTCRPSADLRCDTYAAPGFACRRRPYRPIRRRSSSPRTPGPARTLLSLSRKAVAYPAVPPAPGRRLARQPPNARLNQDNRRVPRRSCRLLRPLLDHRCPAGRVVVEDRVSGRWPGSPGAAVLTALRARGRTRPRVRLHPSAPSSAVGVWTIGLPHANPRKPWSVPSNWRHES